MPKLSAPQLPALPSDIRQAALGKLSAQLTKLQSTHQQVGNVLGEFSSLAKQGDTVTQDALIDAASAMVSHGADPRQVATLLSTAPDSGPALAGWVQQQLAQMQQLHAKVGGVRDGVRQKLLQGAVSHVAQSVREGVQQAQVQMQAQPPSPQISPNPISIGTPNG